MTQNADWFVAATHTRGDGSREHPFHDPWLAFRRAEPGDTIHIAAGIYHGRFDRSSWTVECPRLTVLGGYSADYTMRAPGKTASVFACYPGYEYVRESSLIAGREDHTGLILDGLCFDAAGRNEYSDKSGAGISRIPAMDGFAASFSAPEVTIRNCIFANSANGGVELSGSGSRFENNLLISMIGLSMLHLRSSTQLIEKPIHVARNAFCFMHDLGDPAAGGGDRSQGVRVQCPAVIEDNVFVSCGNSAIATYTDATHVAIERNVFFATPHALIESRAGGRNLQIKEKDLEELEDLGYQTSAGNLVHNPVGSGLPAEWLDAYSRDLFTRYATPPRDAVNTLRAAAGLSMLTPADLAQEGGKGGVSPRYPVAAIANLSIGAGHGCHAIELPVELTARAPAPTAKYPRIDWAAMLNPEPTLANSRVELRVGLGPEQNASPLADATVETHLAVRVYEPGVDENSLYALVPRHSFASRQFREARNYQRGAEVEKTYVMRGTYRTDVSSSRQKATLIVESIDPAPPFTPPLLPARPPGRDWFVRAGSAGGDGGREKPFRDPFQALDQAASGDTVHVAAGEYFGKLRCGRWLITVTDLTLLGGYDPEFTSRDPWTNPTRFVLAADEKAKGRPSGTILQSEENSDGLLVDGFIFDGATWNSYQDGSLSVETSPLAPLIRLRGVAGPVTVRNCLFVNGSDNGVVLDCALAIFENNIVVNTSGDGLIVNANGAGPAVIRNNTLLFAADPTGRAGTGQSSSRGTMIQLKGRGAVELESNLIGFADNYGVRAALPQDHVAMRNNVFAANLFNHLCDCQYLYADGSNWARRVELDSSYELAGNLRAVAPWPVDRTYLDLALARLFTLPSRIGSEEWISIAATLGAELRPADDKSIAAPTPEAAPARESVQSTPGETSLEDLMARISGTTAKLKEIESLAAAPPSAPKYCPIYDYRKALALASDSADNAPGAHRRKLEV